MFTDLASSGPAGTWNGEELFQGRVHIDNNRHEHLIDGMSRNHLVATMRWLDRKAPVLYFQFGDRSDLDCDDEGASGWLTQTPLYVALQKALDAAGGEKAMTPVERSARQPRRYMCTTVSGTVYVVDLDSKTLQRLPAEDDPYPDTDSHLQQPVRLVQLRDMTVGNRAMFQFAYMAGQDIPATHFTDAIVAIHRTLHESHDNDEER